MAQKATILPPNRVHRVVFLISSAHAGAGLEFVRLSGISMIRIFLAVLVLCATPFMAVAQSPVWIQVEAQPTLAAAQTRARAYASQLEDVSGFAIGGGWYAIVLGPYTRADADTLLRQFRSQGRVPRDSYIAFRSSFRQQFWPIGVGAPTTAQPLPGAPVDEPAITPEVTTPEVTTSEITPDTPLIVTPAIQTPDETVREARASEATLSRPEREQLQVALKWAGFYESSIDGAFGRGTRRSMEAWQVANNHAPTGVLTTLQRSELFNAYNAVLKGMDLQLIRDDATGIAMQIPTGIVEFSEYAPPFAQFEPKGDLDARVLLISQEGNQDRLFGLYEILQTLAIVPPEGPRNRRDRSFELEGINEDIHSYTFAQLRDGQIKGFSLIWPAGDEERRSRVLTEMKASFSAVSGVLDPGIAVPDESQAIDLISGLSVRKPTKARSGFFIDGSGAVLTTTEAVGSCSRITIDDVHDAKVVHTDTALGLAVIRPTDALAPLGVAAFQTGVPRLQAEVAVAGFPYGGILTTPSLTFGTLADIRGLNGEEEVKRLSLEAQPGDAGGPVFDNGGAVLGMLMTKADRAGQQLPAEVSFSVDASEIVASLANAGITVETTDSVAFMPPEVLTVRAADVTVLVSCW